MNRREMIVSSLGLATMAEVLEAQQHAREAVASGFQKFLYFDAATAADVEALTAEIIPTDSNPGAKEAGVVFFIDRSLTTFDKENQAPYKTGMADLNAKRLAMFPGSASCAALTSPQRIELLKSVERTPFFQLLRTHTIYGFLSDPSYGGNQNGVGYRTMRYEPAHMYKPPFGYYDAEAAKESAK